MRIILCVNCLEPGANQVPVGSVQGSQRDPYQPKIDLCGECKKALETGDLKKFNARHTDTKTVTT